MSINLMTPSEMEKVIAGKVRAKRLERNLSQQTLSKRSGVSYGSLKKFEQTGQISLESLLKLAIILGCMDHFNTLFEPKSYKEMLSLDEMINTPIRKRGRE